MSYYDDYDDDEYSSEDEIFYHNYSVDYANQILGGHHAISSCLPLMRRKHHRHSPRLVRVSTLDQMPIINRHQFIPSLHSQPKYRNDDDISSSPPPPPRLPSLEATNEELERRATRRTQPTPQETSNIASPMTDNNNSSSPTTHRPMTEPQLRQVQEQQQAFQQHLLNMQRHLLERTQQQQQQQEQEEREQHLPTSLPSTSHRFERKAKVSYHDLERDDDQAQIAELIENDPYFAAAMEDFAHTHGLLHQQRHRTHSNYSSSRHSSHSDKRYRSQDYRDQSPSSSSSTSSLTNVTSNLNRSNTDLILFRELHGIRRLMEEYVRARNNMSNSNPPTVSIMPVPWPIAGTQFPIPGAVHYPPVAPVTDYQPSIVPRERAPPIEPSRAMYQNVVNTVKEVMERRSPSQRDQPLKPSQIDPKLRHVYTRRPRIPSSNSQPMFMQRPPLPPQQQQQQQQQRRRRSSQLSTPPIVSSFPPSPPSNNIPPAPPYEPLSNFSSSRSTVNKTRHLSYGNRQKQSNIYDTLQPGRYLRLSTNKYN